MFDFVRKHTKLMMMLMFLFIIPSFVMFGIDSYTHMREKGDAVARISGHGIMQTEWDAVHKSEADNMRASMPNLDVKLLDSPEVRYASLERLVHERLLGEAADKFRLVTTDQRLAQELQANPVIASLRLPNGKLDINRYRQIAASQGLTTDGFEARVRRDLSARQVEAGITGTGFAASSFANLALNAFYERREIQVANFTPADFAAKVNPSEADLEAFYKANQAAFQAQEQASIEYVVLDLDAVKKTVHISDADLMSYYEQNAARLSGAEERRASHILITAAKSAAEAERQKAKARALELLQVVRKSPGDFADLAKKNSQDPGSAAKGGDLDFFARGAMVKPFEDAVFSMKKGDISDVVESDFGFHIIKLTDVKAPKQRSFDELRGSIVNDLTTQQAQRKFAEAAEAFTNAVYEQSDSLKPVADKLKLEIRTAQGVTRTAAPGASGLLANAKFLAAIFAPDSVEKRHNTEAIETAPNHLVAGRITQYTPATTMAFADVRGVVRERVIAARAAELAKADGMQKLAAWKTAPATANLPAAVVVSRDNSQNVPPQVVGAALHADASALPAVVGVDLGAKGYAVVRVNSVMPRPAPVEPTANQERNQYAKWWTDAEIQAYYGLLKERFKVEILVAKPSTSATEALTAAIK